MRRKYSAEEKVKIVEGYIRGEYSLKAKAKELGYKSTPGCFKLWLKVYQEHGPSGLCSQKQHRSYTKEFKKQVVIEYLNGENSAVGLTAKYKIRTENLLLQWIRDYNANIELTDYDPKGVIYMADARRKTTMEERKEITEYCIAHNKDYASTAAIYKVSYNQVYSWVKKYLSEGEESFIDKRGRHKADDEVDELERLRRENLRLKRQLEDERRTVELLKKAKEFARR